MSVFITKAILLLWKGSINKHYDPNFSKYVHQVLQSSANIISAPVIYTALYYVNQISRLTKTPRASFSEYRIFLTSFILADISLNDCSYRIASWAKVSGIPQAEIIAMKKEFLETLGYDLNLGHDVYKEWVKMLNSTLRNFVHVKQDVQYPTIREFAC